MCRKQLLVVQKGMSKALRNVRAQLEREGAGSSIFAQLDQLDKVNKAQMEITGVSNGHSMTEKEATRKAAKMITEGGTKKIEKGLIEALKFKEEFKEAKYADYQGGLAGLLGGGGGAQPPAQGAAPPAGGGGGGGGGGIGGILQALLPVALQVIPPLLSSLG